MRRQRRHPRAAKRSLAKVQAMAEGQGQERPEQLAAPPAPEPEKPAKKTASRPRAAKKAE